MSELWDMGNSDCGRACGLFAGFVDSDLGDEQTAWLRSHVDVCGKCSGELARFIEIDGALTGWGQRLGEAHPAAANSRVQLQAEIGRRAARRRSIRWSAVAAGLAAVLTLATVLLLRKPPQVKQATSQFVAIPYLPPLDPNENTAIVRVEIRVASLIEAGYKVPADPNEIVPAEVLVGEDGRAHAIRVLSNFEWN